MTPPAPVRLGDKPEKDMIDLLNIMEKLGKDVHSLKGNLAANSQMTQMTLNKQDQLHERQDATDQKIDALTIKIDSTDSKIDSQVARSEELLVVFEAGKKGVSVLQTLGKWATAVAKWFLRWIAPILTAGALIYGIFHGQWPGDHK